MKTELLVQMDGLARSSDLVFVLAASNLPWCAGENTAAAVTGCRSIFKPLLLFCSQGAGPRDAEKAGEKDTRGSAFRSSQKGND